MAHHHQRRPWRRDNYPADDDGWALANLGDNDDKAGADGGGGDMVDHTRCGRLGIQNPAPSNWASPLVIRFTPVLATKMVSWLAPVLWRGAVDPKRFRLADDHSVACAGN